MLRVLNIASFIPIEGFHRDNDISLKIYAELRENHNIDSIFIKPVPHIPSWLAILKNSLRRRRKIITDENYVDKTYNLRVHFFQSSFPLVNKFFYKKTFLKPLEYKFYSQGITKIVNNFRPDIIHAHTVFPDGYLAMKLWETYGIPYILTIRGTYADKFDQKRIHEILRHARSLNTPSYSIYKALAPFFDVELLPHGIDDYWYRSLQRNFNKKLLKIITIARLMDWKNIHLVLLAIADLKKLGVKIEYSIIGDGPYRKELENIVELHDLSSEITFHGWLCPKEIMQLCEKKDIFIMLSYPETFGRAFFEAAAQGLLIIGAKNTGAHGHFSDEEAIFLDIDKEQIKNALLNLETEEFIRRSHLSRKKAEKYKNSSIINRYNQILKGATK